MRLTPTAEPRPPIIATGVTLANLSPERFRAEQRRRAAVTTAGNVLRRATFGLFEPKNHAERLGYASEGDMLMKFKNDAEGKVGRLAENQAVKAALLDKGEVHLLHRTGGTLHSQTGNTEDMSTIVVVDATLKDGDTRSVQWRFDCINGIAENRGRRSWSYFRTSGGDESSGLLGAQHSIVGMGAVDVSSGEYFSSEDYAPSPYSAPYHEIAFYGLARELFGSVESGFSFPEDNKRTYVLTQ